MFIGLISLGWFNGCLSCLVYMFLYLNYSFYLFIESFVSIINLYVYLYRFIYSIYFYVSIVLYMSSLYFIM